MKAVEAKLLKFLESGKQFVIPIYQRTYSWREPECEQLWTDILRAGNSDEINAHFVGSVVYIEQDQSTVVQWSPLMVIDGQQRLTTVSLLLAALGQHVKGDEPVDGFSADKIREYYLVNRLEKGERLYRLLLSQTDKTSLCAIIGDLPEPHIPSVRIYENFEFFKRKIKESAGKIDVVCRGISKLMIVDVSLTRGVDNPQLVFESLNSTGRELSHADLIRNYVLMSLEPDLQSRLYDHYWRPMELEFGQEGYVAHFDNFMRHYLTVRTGDVPRNDQVYAAFKTYAASNEVEGVESLMREILDYSRYYNRYALGKETDKELAEAFHDLRDQRMGVEYPLILELYADFEAGRLAKSDFAEIVRLIDSYIFRRAVCQIPTNSLNRTFSTFARSLDKDRYLESVRVEFLSKSSYRRFPSNEEFERNLKSRDLYNFRLRSYWLRRIENFLRKERVPVDQYTVEHIMPQNEELRPEWRTMLGENWQRVHSTYLHTLGNLTLTGYNSEYSDKPFLMKRDMEGGFAHSPLKVNEGLGQLDEWNEDQIVLRAEKLAQLASKIWVWPEVSPEALSALKLNPPSPASEFTLDSYPQLQLPEVRQMFEKLRQEVLALDPVVTEVCRADYIAYKAETNFVNVYPQQMRLCLVLKIPMVELDDPQGLAESAGERGWAANGAVRFSLDSFDALPYAMSLIRQAFDRQMGEVG
ncbi:MAG TPA: DUF262 and DUF1524 domain-containing protein [Fimbriimonadaceae bacterium]|nr:DUF262 and DUF1524 domain-containing protein [Fimbriimonadaceae bacterium]